MTYKELIEDVIVDLDEDMEDQDTIDKVKRFINRGYKELAKRENLEKTKSTYAFEGKFKKPADMVTLYWVKFEGKTVPFSIEGKYVTTTAEGEVEICYSYIPEALEELEDETLTSATNDEFIINYAKWLYCMYDGNVDLAAYYKGEVNVFKASNQAKIVPIADIWG